MWPIIQIRLLEIFKNILMILILHVDKKFLQIIYCGFGILF